MPLTMAWPLRESSSQWLSRNQLQQSPMCLFLKVILTLFVRLLMHVHHSEVLLLSPRIRQTTCPFCLSLLLSAAAISQVSVCFGIRVGSCSQSRRPVGVFFPLLLVHPSSCTVSHSWAFNHSFLLFALRHSSFACACLLQHLRQTWPLVRYQDCDLSIKYVDSSHLRFLDHVPPLHIPVYHPLWWFTFLCSVFCLLVNCHVALPVIFQREFPPPHLTNQDELEHVWVQHGLLGSAQVFLTSPSTQTCAQSGKWVASFSRSTSTYVQHLSWPTCCPVSPQFCSRMLWGLLHMPQLCSVVCHSSLCVHGEMSVCLLIFEQRLFRLSNQQVVCRCPCCFFGFPSSSRLKLTCSELVLPVSSLSFSLKVSAAALAQTSSSFLCASCQASTAS